MSILDDAQAALTQLVQTSQNLAAANAVVAEAAAAEVPLQAALDTAHAATLTAQNAVIAVQQTHDSEVTALKALISQL